MSAHGASGVRAEGAGATPARRGLWAFGAVALGAWLGLGCESVPSCAWFAGAAAGAAAGLLARGRPCAILLMLACIACGAGSAALRVHERAGANPLRAVERAGAGGTEAPVVAVDGLVRAGPSRRAAGGGGALAAHGWTGDAWSFELDADGLDAGRGPTPVRGRVRVLLEAAQDAHTVPAPGARVRVTGRAYVREPAGNPGEPDVRRWDAQAGRLGTLAVPDAALITPLPAREGFPARLARAGAGAHAWLRARATDALERVLPAGPPDARALAGALLLGVQETGFDDLEGVFARAGLVHVLSISGFHLVVLAGVVALGARRLGERAWVEPCAVLAAVGAYALVVPDEAPIRRAAVMTAALVAPGALGRRYDRLTVLGWTGAGMVLARPMDVLAPGFQLTFLVTGALLAYGPGAGRRLLGLQDPVRQDPGHAPHAAPLLLAAGALGRALAVGILAWLVGTPIVMHHAGLVSPVEPFASLLALPLSVAALAVGQGALLGAGLGVPGVELAAPPLAWICGGLAALVRGAEALPGAWIAVPAVSGPWAACASACALALFDRRARVRRLALRGVPVLAAWLAVGWAAVPRLDPPALRVDALAVGDGSCLLVRSGRDAMLWDCGGAWSGIGVRTIPRACRELGAHRVRRVLVTHPDLDHFRGLLDAAGPLGVREVLVTGRFLAGARREPRSAPGVLVAALRARGIRVATVRAGDVLRLGDARLDVAWPPADDDGSLPDNDMSAVAVASVGTRDGARAIVLTGDAGVRALAAAAAALTRPGPGPATPGPPGVAVVALEAPHHGSPGPALRAALRRWERAVVLQSSGARRAAEPRLARLRAGRTWLATGESGAVWVRVDADGAVSTGASSRRADP